MNRIESKNKFDLFTEVEQAKIKAIVNFVKTLENKPIKDPGLINGRLGSFLFLFSYAKRISLNESECEIAFSILTDCIIRIVNGQKDFLYYKNIADLGLLLIDLKRNQYVDESVNPILKKLDELSNDGVRSLINQQLFDPFVGYLSLANYLIQRIDDSVEAKQSVCMVVDALLESSIVEDGESFWVSKLFNDDRVYLGWSHGLTSVMLFFCRVLSTEIQYKSNLLVQKIKENVTFLATHMRLGDTNFLYPDIVGVNDKLGAFNLCYGDLGVNFGLYTVGLTLKDKSLTELAVKGFYHTAARELNKDCQVHDSSIIYGSMGICLYYKKLGKALNDQRLLRAAKYWYGQANKMCSHENTIAGYKRHYNTHNDTLNESLFEGVVGYGLGLLEYHTNKIGLLNLIGY